MRDATNSPSPFDSGLRFPDPDDTLGTNLFSLDAANPFEAILIRMTQVHRQKKHDYAGDSHPNQNFYDSAYQIGLTGGHSVEQLIATKQARLRVLLPMLWNESGRPLNEGIADTLLDRAVYSVIALTLFDEGGYERDTPPVQTNTNKEMK